MGRGSREEPRETMDQAGAEEFSVLEVIPSFDFFSQLPCLCPNLLLQSQGPLQGCVPPHSTQGTCQPLQLTPASAPLSRLGESLILLPPPALSPRRRLSHSTFLLGKQQQKINKGSEEEVLARRALVGVAPDRDTLKSDQKKVG